MFSIPTRLLMLGLFLTCCALLGFAIFYLEGVELLAACALCMSQRVFFLSAGLLGLLAFLHNPHALGLKVYGALISLSAIAGGGLAARHLWLQSLPPGEAPACGPSLEYLFDAFPVSQALELLLMGDGNCAETVWTMLGISIPGWSVISFAAILVWGLICLFRSQQLAAKH